MRRPVSLFLVCVLFTSSFAPSVSYAQASVALDAGFNPHAILRDEDLFSIDQWSAERIQQFLVSKKSALAHMTLKDIDGVKKRPSDILWRVAGSYVLNPQYLLVLLQKEQSLIEDPSPSEKQLDWATGFGVCDACSMDDPTIQDFKGFANQLEYAAKQHRERYLFQLLMRGTTIAGHAPGKTSVIDGTAVTPINQATAMLYSYTPHIHGNQTVWRIWRRWFSRTLPDGTLVSDMQTKDLFLIRGGERRPLRPVIAATLVRDTKKVLQARTEDLEPYPLGAPIRFPDFSLLQTPTGTRYLLVGEQKRRFASKRAFLALGFQEDEVIETTEEDLREYSDGPDITEQSRYPLGLLAKDARGTYWYIENETRHVISHPIYLSLYFRGRPARLLKTADLARFPISTPYRLHDGELVRSETLSTVYVIERGNRRPIPNEQVFEAFGYRWNNILSLPESALKAHPLGEPLDPPWQSPSDLDTIASDTSSLASFSL